jgi:uroporphyrinogen-III decarboxylase
MTPRDRVLTAFEHREPDSVPAWCGSSAEFWAKAKRELGIADDEVLRLRFGDDFRRVTAPYRGDLGPLSPGATCKTVFGVERHGLGYGQPISHPLAHATLAQVHAHHWPDAKSLDVSQVKTEAEAYGKKFAILGGDWSPFWHDAIDLLGMEQLYLLMYDEPDVVDAVMKHLVDYYAAANERIFAAAGSAIDILFIGNDLGSQNGPLLSPAQFERFVLPQLRRLIDIGHAHHVKVMMHCCGGFLPLIPALIAAGLDGLHAIQPCCAGMDLRALKREFGEKILFNGAIDSQHVLIDGTPATVRQRTREVLEIMKPGGGYIAGASHDSILEETPVENVLAMFDAIREFGA